MKHLTDEEIIDVATQHCEFTAEGTYHLRKFRGWAIVQVVRDCFDLAELCRQAEAPLPGGSNDTGDSNG
jgi:hypothetical protein